MVLTTACEIGIKTEIGAREIVVLLAALVLSCTPASAQASATVPVAKPPTVPAPYHTITPYLVLKNAGKAIDFYKELFGAQERGRHTTSDGKHIVHAELKLGDSIIMIEDDFSDMGVGRKKIGPQAQCSLFMYVPDVDKLYDRAIKAGCTTLYPLQNQFWGDRFCGVLDPFGQEWALATHQEDVSDEEIGKRAREQFHKMSEQTDALLKKSDSNSPQK